VSDARSGSWLPFAIPAAVAVLIVSLTFAFGHRGSSDEPALSCPKTLQTSTERPWVPKASDPVDTEGRLAPDRLPTHAVVCFYRGSGKRGQPPSKPLTGAKQLSGSLNALVDTVAYVPHKIASQARCPTSLREDNSYYLLGLTYVDGHEWIDAAEDVCAAVPTTNGSYDSSAFLSEPLRSAYRAGSWPTTDGDQPCAAKGVGRMGQETSLVPANSTSVDLCKLSGNLTVVGHARPAVDAAAEALNKLPTSPMTGGGCFGWYASPGAAYRLVFHYDAGADAVVLVETSKDCVNPVSNGSLRSSDASAVIPLLDQLLAAH
jgi:hypothetical protein